MHILIVTLVFLYATLWLFVGLVNHLVGYRALNYPTPSAIAQMVRSWVRHWWDGSHDW